MKYTDLSKLDSGGHTRQSINQSINQTRQFLTRRNTAKPLQGRYNGSWVTWVMDDCKESIISSAGGHVGTIKRAVNVVRRHILLN